MEDMDFREAIIVVGMNIQTALAFVKRKIDVLPKNFGGSATPLFLAASAPNSPLGRGGEARPLIYGA